MRLILNERGLAMSGLFRHVGQILNPPPKKRYPDAVDLDLRHVATIKQPSNGRASHAVTQTHTFTVCANVFVRFSISVNQSSCVPHRIVVVSQAMPRNLESVFGHLLPAAVTATRIQTVSRSVV